MTKEEYQDFVLRYKGCGACFPMYHTLNRFEKMWFTAIQKDVAELEKENSELQKLYHESDEDNNKLRENIPLLAEAKEIIKKLKALYLYPVVTKDDVKRQDEILEEAEKFLNSEG